MFYDGWGACWICGKGFVADLYKRDDPDQDSGYYKETGEYLCEECWETRDQLDLITDEKVRKKINKGA